MKKNNLNKIYLIYFLVISLFVALRIASSLGAFSFITDATILSLVTSVIIQVVILFGFPLLLTKLILKKNPKTVFKDYNFSMPSSKVVLYSFGIGILTCILNFFIAFVFSAIISMLGYEGLRGLGGEIYSYNTPLKFVIGVFCVGILPAFCEEFLHRGFVLNETKTHIGYKRAIIISSVLFGLMHLNINQVFYAIILGLIMGFVSVASNNIWPAIIMHFTNNFINVYLDFASSAGLPLGSLNQFIVNIFSQNLALGLVVASLTICLVSAGLIYSIALLYKNTRYKQLEKQFYALQLDMAQVGENGEPLTPEEAKVGFDIYYKQSFKNINSVVDLMVPKTENDNTKVLLKQKIFLIATLVLGVLITVFTFIWGIY